MEYPRLILITIRHFLIVQTCALEFTCVLVQSPKQSWVKVDYSHLTDEVTGAWEVMWFAKKPEVVEVEFETTLVISKPIFLSAVLISLVFFCIHFIIPIHILAKNKKENRILRCRATLKPVWVCSPFRGRIWTWEHRLWREERSGTQVCWLPGQCSRQRTAFSKIPTRIKPLEGKFIVELRGYLKITCPGDSLSPILLSPVLAMECHL